MANYFDTGILLTAGFSLSSQAPLDGRSVVELLTDLDTHIAENRAYEGMCVYVKENKKNYIYNGTTWEEFVGGGGSSEEQIKDWVSGDNYLEGDYIYHEGEIYRCLTSNSDVDFDETNWEQVTYGIDELSKEDVERLLGLTEEELEAMASLISDTEVRIDKTYSSSKIYADIQQCLEDSKTYTLEEVEKVKIDDTLTTTDKTITGAINEVNGNLLDTVGFSADYKNIILNRKNGLNPYTIPISAIINNTSLAELKDVDSTDVGDGKILVYDGATNKHKYVDSSITDELVKMDNTTDANYLINLIDKSTVVNDNGVLKVKKLDGQEVTITEINYLKGLTMNIMDLVNLFSNGGVKVLNTPLNTASELDTMDRTSFINGISYIVYVLADENHSGLKTTYLVDKTNTTFFGNVDNQRNFTTNPIDLANEVTGKLGTSNIDVDNLWTLLTINDTYKTLTTNNEIFGTHGAKAMYDELVTDIGGKANATDLTTHTGDANIHVTATDKAKWDKVTDKLNVADFNTHKNNTDIHITTTERTKWDKVTNKLDAVDFNTHKNNTDIHITKEEKDKLVTTDDITDTIDINSSGTKIPNVKAVYNDIIIGKDINQTVIDTYGTEILKYPLGIWRFGTVSTANKFEDLPVKTGGRMEITSIKADTNSNPWNSSWAYRVYNFETFTGMNYFRKVTSTDKAGKNSDTGWKELATMDKVDDGYAKIIKNNDTDTNDAMFIAYKNRDLFGLRIYKDDYSEHELRFSASGISYVKNGVTVWTTTEVADVGVTTITPVNSAITGTIEYTVKNGICYVSMKDLMSTISSTGLLISTTMPKPSVNCNAVSINSSGNVATIYIDKNTTKLNGNFYEKNAKSNCSFSYPVAE